MYIMNQINKFSKLKMEYDIDNDPLLGEDTISDHNNIEFKMKIRNLLKIFKLVLIMFNVSYFVGIIFMIFAEVTMAISTELGDID